MLKVDGIFGPLTNRAVSEFQRSRSLKGDGVVGRSTWCALAYGKPNEKRAAASVPSATVGPVPGREGPQNIIDWPLERKFREVVNRVPGKLPVELRSQFLALVSVQSLVIFLAAFAGSWLFGVGELVGIGMILILGEQALFEIGHAIQITALGATNPELDDAAGHLARAIALVGVALFAGEMAKFLPGKGTGKSRGALEEGSPVSTVRRPAEQADIYADERNAAGEKSAGNEPERPKFTEQETLAQQRQVQMLKADTGYNVSPKSWDKYPTIGKNGTYLTDQQAIAQSLGELPEGQSSISKAQARQLESDLGLEEGSLDDGFKIRRVQGLQKRGAGSPLEGNELFRGPGKHLPGGGPEMRVDPIPTTDGNGVSTIMNVEVR